MNAAGRARLIRALDGWTEDDASWRDPEEVVAGRRFASPIDRGLLEMTARGDWWGILERLDVCLVVSREYEHLLLALTMAAEGPRQSFMNLPHPSSLAFDATAERLHVASTRNPNQLYVLAPTGRGAGANGRGAHEDGRPLVALSADFLPGRLYLHDLAAERAGETAGEIYNVGSRHQTTLRELVDCVRDLLAIPAEPDWGTHPQRAWDTDIWCASTERIARDLRWSARTEIEEGLRHTISWMRTAWLAPGRSS